MDFTTPHYVRRLLVVVALGLITSTSSCLKDRGSNGKTNYADTIILVSLDGFRWDYLERTATPQLDEFVRQGVKAKALIPIFPSKTFPNHLSMATGRYAENHGIVSNSMYDPLFNEWYYIGEGSEPVQDGKWYDAEPVWVTAERQGQIAMTMFWPGSEVEIKGYRPSEYYIYNGSIPNADRVDQVLNWLDYPQAYRPTFISLYFSDPDSWGHYYGPDSPEMATVVQYMDQLIGQLVSGLEERGILEEINIIIVSDHGMVSISRDSMIFLDDYINMDEVLMVDWTPVAAIRPGLGKLDSVYQQLQGAHPHLQVFKKDDIPQRYHYQNHRRIQPIIAIADEGWSISTREFFNNNPNLYTGGKHGYDPTYVSMRGIFLARGPAFKSGYLSVEFTNIHLYELMTTILNLDPAVNDGHLDSVKNMLKNF